MLTFSAAELQRRLGEIQDRALTQPVSITRNGRERLVILSAEEYRRLKRQDRQALRAGELSDAELDAIAHAEVPPEYSRLDDELATKKPRRR